MSGGSGGKVGSQNKRPEYPAVKWGGPSKSGVNARAEFQRGAGDDAVRRGKLAEHKPWLVMVGVVLCRVDTTCAFDGAR